MRAKRVTPPHRAQPGGHDLYREHNPLITAAGPDQRLPETLGKIGPKAARAQGPPVISRAPKRDSTAPPPRVQTAPTTPQGGPRRNNAAESLPAACIVNLRVGPALNRGGNSGGRI